MRLKIGIFAFILCLCSCSSTRDGRIGQLPDSFIDAFDVEDESIDKFLKNKNEEPASEVKEKVVGSIPQKEITKKQEEKKIQEPSISKLIKRYRELDLKSKKLWKTFKPIVMPGEKYFFSVYFWGIRVGMVEMRVEDGAEIAGKEAYHLSGQLQSARFYEYIYTIDDRLDTFIDAKRFVPLKYVLRQRESKQEIDDLQLFDYEKKKTFSFYKRIKKGKTKKRKKVAPIPQFFQDTFSTFFFIRGLPLKIGDTYQFPIMSRAKLKLFKIKVLGTETIEIMDKDVKAIKFQASTFLPGVLKEKKKKEHNDKILFWFSNDAQRRFLRAEASVKLGSISGEVVGYCAAPGVCQGDIPTK